MSNNLVRLRGKRNHKTKAAQSHDDVSRRLLERPSLAERMLRARGFRPAVAKILAIHAGLPVDGDQ